MEATQFIRSMIEEGVIDPDWPTLKKDDYRAGWKQGKCGMQMENFAALSTKSNYKAFDENFPEGQWDVLDVPAGPYGDRSAGTIIRTGRYLRCLTEGNRRGQRSCHCPPVGMDGH